MRIWIIGCCDYIMVSFNTSTEDLDHGVKRHIGMFRKTRQIFEGHVSFWQQEQWSRFMSLFTWSHAMWSSSVASIDGLEVETEEASVVPGYDGGRSLLLLLWNLKQLKKNPEVISTFLTYHSGGYLVDYVVTSLADHSGWKFNQKSHFENRDFLFFSF